MTRIYLNKHAKRNEKIQRVEQPRSRNISREKHFFVPSQCSEQNDNTDTEWLIQSIEGKRQKAKDKHSLMNQQTLQISKYVSNALHIHYHT
jgi:hypothetical protein